MKNIYIIVLYFGFALMSINQLFSQQQFDCFPEFDNTWQKKLFVSNGEHLHAICSVYTKTVGNNTDVIFDMSTLLGQSAQGQFTSKELKDALEYAFFARSASADCDIIGVSPLKTISFRYRSKCKVKILSMLKLKNTRLGNWAYNCCDIKEGPEPMFKDSFKLVEKYVDCLGLKCCARVYSYSCTTRIHNNVTYPPETTLSPNIQRVSITPCPQSSHPGQNACANAYPWLFYGHPNFPTNPPLHECEGDCLEEEL